LHSQLSMQDHTSNVASFCFFHLRWLCQLHHMVAQDVRQRLVSALALSHIHYCNLSLTGLPAVTLAPLHGVLNAAAHYVADLRPHDHMRSVQRSPHWLPIYQWIQYKFMLTDVRCCWRVCSWLHQEFDKCQAGHCFTLDIPAQWVMHDGMQYDDPIQGQGQLQRICGLRGSCTL